MSELQDWLRLFADDTRLRILHLLGHEALTVGELQDVLQAGQSSVSSHLARLKAGGLIHQVTEGSSHRYQLRHDMDARLLACWQSVRDLSKDDPRIAADRQRFDAIQRERCTSWIDRVAGSLHRSYAPGRTWSSLTHALLPFIDLGVMVDVGAGDGSLLELLAPQAKHVHCIDPHDSMVKAGRQRAKRLHLKNVTYHQTRGESLPLDDRSVDAVLFLQSLQYIDAPAQAVAEARRVLRPKGRLVLLTLAEHHYPESTRYGHQHAGFAPDDLRQWCAGMRSVRVDLLEQEARAPHFVPLLAIAEQPG